MAREHYNTSEKDGSCQWNCLTSYAGAQSKQFRDHQEAQMSFEKQPQPVSPIAYATPIRRNTVAIPETNRFTTWFSQDPYGKATNSLRSTSVTPEQSRHRSWFKQDPYASTEQRSTRGKSWFSQDPYGQPRQSTSSSFATVKRSFTSKSRPSISAPTDFRRVTDPLPEPMPARRRSFRPLELSIYVEPSGRLSPLPDFGTDEWELKIVGLSKPPTALLRRETMDNSQLHGDFSVPRKPLSTYSGYNPRRQVVSEPFLLSPENGPGPGPVIDESYAQVGLSVSDLGTIDENRTPTLAASELDNMALVASHTQSQRSSGYSMTTVRQQPILARHNRSESGTRSSKGSFRRSKSDAVDEAIMELNTIIEEKRIKAKMESLTSPPLSPTSHVPAIAPAMTVRARSETLSDIGSAFSTSVAAPLPAGSSPNMSNSRIFTRSPLPIQLIMTSEAPITSADSSATALPQMPSQSPLHSPKPQNPLKSNPVKSQSNRKDRLSIWLKRVSNTPVSKSPITTMPPSSFYQLNAKDVGQRPDMHVRSSASLDTITTFSSASSNDAALTTPATTVAPTLSPTSPSEPAPRPSISKTPQSMRRVPKRGLSIDTTLSNGSRTVPPAYHELDPHPLLVGTNGEITPSRIGVAC